MRKGILKMGIWILIIGALLLLLAGANPPKLPYIYGSNQTYWIFMAIAGLVIALIGLLMGGKNKQKLSLR